MKHFISIIIINWDGAKYLKECIPSLLRVKTQHRLEIIVVDNGSKDDSIAYLKSQEKTLNKKKIELVILKNKTNQGFAHGNNQGYEVARGDFVLLLNNDTDVAPNFLDALVKTLESNKKIAGVQPKLLFMEDHKKFDSTGSFFTKTGILYHRGHQQKDRLQFEKTDRVFSMKGACMLFRKSILDKVGLFDESYFAYFEETDLCHRLWLSGYENLYEPKSVVYHKVGGTTSKVGSPFIQYHSFKNRIQSYITNFELGTLVWLMPIHLFLSFGIAFSFLFMGKTQHFLAVLKAFGWIINNFSSVLKKRKHVQRKLRKVTDSNYLAKVERNVGPIYYWYLLVGGLEKYQDKNSK